MIKFRCLNCGQKLAVREDGIGAVVSCTNCPERIVVPPYSITEFFSAEPTQRANMSVTGGMELMRPAMEGVDGGSAALRTALIPHLARMMMNRSVQALFAQRETLIDTQAEATQRMADMAERITRAQMNVRKKIMGYEERIADLERQLAAKERENDELLLANFQLRRKALEAENAAASAAAENIRPLGATRVDLSHAGFLLRA